MDQTASQLTNEELNCFMDKWEKEALVQTAAQAEERSQTEELNSLVDKWENEALFQMAEQEKAQERCQSEELNSFMDMWEKEEKDGLIQKADQDVEGGQINLPLQPTHEQKVRKISV